MKPLVSVIVPVYNVENFLPKCLDSLSRQSLSSIEILVIDDASTDNSGKICKEYAERDSRFKVFHNKKNRGLAVVRNIGVEKATSDYIMFLDSDDWAAVDYCQIAYECAVRKNADIVTFAYQCVKENKLGKLETVFIEKVKEGLKSREEAIELTFESFGMVAWNKLYRKKLFEHIIYPEGFLFEDTATTYKLIWNASRIYCIENVLYYHLRARPGSIMSNSKTVKAIKDITKINLWHSYDLYSWGYQTRTMECRLISAALGYCFTNKKDDNDKEYLIAEKILKDVRVLPKAYSWKSGVMVRLFQFNRALFDIVCVLFGKRVD